jgi:predicted dehydrogenase
MNRRTILATSLAAAPAVILGAAKPPKLKYLQIGTGHPHANKFTQYASSDDWEVVGIVEENPELRRRAEKDKTYQAARFLPLEEALNTPNLKVIGIETPVRDLLRYAEIAIDANCHIHLDKPAGADLQHYQRILTKADQKNLVIQMGYMYRYNPAIQLLHRIIREGWLGQIFETHAVMSKVVPSSQRQELDEFPGGIMFELGGHIIDLTIGVLGRPDQVQAYPRRTLLSNSDTLVDNMLAVLEYPKATATVRSTALEVEGGSRRHFTVCGTEGTVHIQPLDSPTIKLSLAQERKFSDEPKVFKKGHTEIVFGNYPRYGGDAADLARIIRGEKENPYPTSHDLAVQETLLTASGM